MAWKEMTRNQKRMYRIHKQEEKINELQKRIDKAIEFLATEHNTFSSGKKWRKALLDILMGK